MASASYLAAFTGFWLIAPAIFYLLRGRRSQFVGFHAVQALMLQFVLIPIAMLGLGVATAIVTAIEGLAGRGAFSIWIILGALIAGIAIAFPGAIILWMGLSALRGGRRSLPILGRWAHQVVGDTF